MKNLNLVISNIEEQRTLDGIKSTENIVAYVGNITPEMNGQNQDPMYLNVNAFDMSTIPPEIARQLQEKAARRITESALARRRGQELQMEQAQ